MKIMVCIKQVADNESNLVINKDSSWIEENNRIAFRINRYDEYALEEALLIKDAVSGVTVDVISVGSERVESSLKKCLERGADSAVLIKWDDPTSAAVEIADMISGYAADKHYDIIFAGVMSEDLMRSQVGPMIAAFLGMPAAVSVVKTELINGLTAISADSELEGGIIEKIEIALPCLITVQTGINRPRYPSLSNVMRAKSMQVTYIDCGSPGGYCGFEEIVSFGYPPVSSKGIVITGNSEEKAEKLINLFHEKALL